MPSGHARMTRDDFRKAKELEELRKTGQAPPELDEEGKMINPHIPQYVAQAPWYLDAKAPGLKHQRASHFATTNAATAAAATASIDTYYKRGVIKTQRGNKKATYRPGACANCGALTHKERDCLERRRRRGAKLTGHNIAPDEYIPQDLKLNFDGKRDRWNGYDPAQYKQVIDMYARTEEARRAAKAAEIEAKLREKQKAKEGRAKKRAARRAAKIERRAKREAAKKGDATTAATVSDPGQEDDDVMSSLSETSSSSSDDDDDADAAADDVDDLVDSTGAVIHMRSDTAKQTTNRTTARNLRTREDTAKYLLNLDVNSAYFDPKTRSMRANPRPDRPAGAGTNAFVGDNFVRSSGDVKEIRELQTFAWEKSADVGGAVGGVDAASAAAGVATTSLMAAPSAVAKAFREHQKKNEVKKAHSQKEILSKYGGDEHMMVPDARLIMGESEAYVEYDERGSVVKGQEMLAPKTKYAEDELEGNHKEVWGSFYDLATSKWGYSCCHLTIRGAYCTGRMKEATPQLNTSRQDGVAGVNVDGAGTSRLAASESDAGKVKWEERKRRRKKEKRKDSKHKKRRRTEGDRHGIATQKFDTSMKPSDEQMDAYYRTRGAKIDPMANVKAETVVPL